MRRDTWVSTVIVSAAVAAVVQLGCQSYELDPVDPKALGAKTETHLINGSRTAPYVMLVVDRSGSMKDNDQDHKWSDLVASFTSPDGFLLTYGASMYFGLILFANPDSGAGVCSPGTVVEPVGTPVDQVVQRIKLSSPGGSTPTAESLKAVLSDSKMNTPEAGRDRFAMLLTDGAPNCNRNLNPATCVPTDPNSTTADSCLDDVATIAQVKALAEKNINTFVIGFGKDTGDRTKSTYQTLDGAAEAGRTARVDGSGSPLEPKFYQANNKDELAAALGAIGTAIGTCNYVLNPAPASPSLLQVVFVYTQAGNREEQLVANTDYSYGASSNTLTITGARCTEILSGPTGLDVEFRYVTSL